MTIEQEPSEKEAREFAKYLLRREMKKMLVNLDTLSFKLKLDKQALQNKINRASFSSGFFFQVIKILGCKNLDLSDFDVYIKQLRNLKADSEIENFDS